MAQPSICVACGFVLAGYTPGTTPTPKKTFEAGISLRIYAVPIWKRFGLQASRLGPVNDCGQDFRILDIDFLWIAKLVRRGSE